MAGCEGSPGPSGIPPDLGIPRAKKPVVVSRSIYSDFETDFLTRKCGEIDHGGAGLFTSKEYGRLINTAPKP